MTTRRLIVLALVSVAAVASVGPFARALPLADLVPPVLLTVVGSVAVVAAAAVLPVVRRIGAGAAVAAALAAEAVALLVLFRHGSPHSAAIIPAALDGLRRGWSRLLDVTLPAAGTADLLVPPQVLAWAAAAAGAEIAVVTRSALLPLLPAFAVFPVSLAYSESAAGPAYPAAAVLVAALLCLLFVRRAAAGRAVPLRSGVPPWRARVTGPLLAVAGATLVAVAVVPFAPFVHDSHPGDLRTDRSVVLRSEDATSPLDEVSAWLGSPDATLFTISGGNAETVRLVALDRFDGASWTSSAHFQPAGTAVPREAGPSRPARVDQTIAIGALTGTYVPAVDRPLSLHGTDLVVDDDSGMLASSRPLAAGDTFSVVSAPEPAYSPDELAGLQPGSDPAARADLSIPAGLPASVRQVARLAERGGRTPLQRAYWLEQYLRTRFTYSPEAPPGHSYGHLDYFLRRSRTGTAEQFATTYAMAARVIGLPTRVVVGFDGARHRVGDLDQVRGTDVLVWPEVDFGGVGWLAFYPTPRSGARGSTQVASSAQGESQGRAQRVAQAAEQPVRAVAAGQSTPSQHGGGPPTVLIAASVIAAAAFCAGVALAVSRGRGVLRRRGLRRARRAEATARGRVVGAWQETLDTLERHGAPLARSASPGEVAELVGHILPAVEPLSRMATTALFADSAPSAETAAEAWARTDDVQDAIGSTRVRRRLRAVSRPAGLGEESPADDGAEGGP